MPFCKRTDVGISIRIPRHVTETEGYDNDGNGAIEGVVKGKRILKKGYMHKLLCHDRMMLLTYTKIIFYINFKYHFAKLS